MPADEPGSLSPQVLLTADHWQGAVKTACDKPVLVALKPLWGLTFLMGTITLEFKPDRPDFTSSTPNLGGSWQNGSACTPKFDTLKAATAELRQENSDGQQPV
jgi:hypothetical protein